MVVAQVSRLRPPSCRGGCFRKQVTLPISIKRFCQMKVKKTVTPLKLQANQENAKQSTGPKTPKGKSYVDRKEWSFYPQGSLPTIQRYNTANRRAMLTNLELLEKRHAAEEAETELEPADSEDAASADENGTELANQEPTETPVDNAGELPQSFSAKPSPQATLPNPKESDGNSLDIPVVESELSDETQQSENPAPGETAA